jgi:serine/threonine protein kinase
LAQKHITDFAARPSTINSDLTADIDDVVMKALAKDPTERFNSAAEMLAAWKNAIGQPQAARSVAPTAMMKLPEFNIRSDTVRKVLASPRVAVVGVGALLTCGFVILVAWGAASVITAPDLPKLIGSATVNGVTVQAESAIGSKSIKVTFENKNALNYAAQISTSNGQAKSAVLKQPSGFKFPLNPEKDFLTLKPNQKETLTLNFDVFINANDALIFQWIAADVGGIINLTVNLALPS